MLSMVYCMCLQVLGNRVSVKYGLLYVSPGTCMCLQVLGNRVSVKYRLLYVSPGTWKG